LESIHYLDPGKTLLISTDDQNHIVEAKGKIAYCREASEGKFLIGVSFTGSPEEIIRFVEGLIRAYYYQRRQGKML
jgi:DNA-binding MurR/RpiR family transcriptional regulator